MNAAYQHLALADVKPGMLLSDELLDKQGQVLLPAGALLTAAIIALLPSHGVTVLAIRCDALAVETAPATDPGALETRLARLFRKNDIDDQNDWATGILRRYVEDYRLDREIAQ